MKFLEFIFTAVLAQVNNNSTRVETPVITRTFPLLEALFSDD